MHLRAGSRRCTSQSVTATSRRRSCESWPRRRERPSAPVSRALAAAGPGARLLQGRRADAGHAAHLPELARLDRPILVGPSRKSFLGRVLGLPSGERLLGTAAAVAACALAGAHVVRVHDVAEMVQVVRVCDAIRGNAPQPPRRRCGDPRTPRRVPGRQRVLVARRPGHPDRRLHHLRAAAVHPRHARRADGARRLRAGRALLDLPVARLQTVNWLLRTFLPYLVFGIIVVFQAEIRKVLAHLGALRCSAPSEAPRPRASWTRCAGLDLARLAAHGRHHRARAGDRAAQLHRDRIALDALVTYDLLLSIFNRGHPSTTAPSWSRKPHRRGRLLPAADRQPGAVADTRQPHRAAIGVTEDTDALAVVVSEENGLISLVSGGTIRRASTDAP